MKDSLLAILIGFLLDAMLGDPHALPHPVRLLGALIGKSEQVLRALLPKTKRGELLGGTLLVLLVSTLTGGAVLALCLLAGRAGGYWSLAIQSLLAYYLLAARSLWKESTKVLTALKKGKTEDARQAVSMIVGRDTACLDEAGITRAAVETVAENTSDGVIAPLFYLALGGPVLGWIYKAVNTMDSMVGYQNERYRYFGRVAARLDDLMNLLPSRLSALLMVAAAWLQGLDGKGAYVIWKRDRRNHKSPNSAQTEAACAGALGLRLAGDAWYFGVLCKKPYIGTEKRAIEAEDIRRANHLMYGTAILMLMGIVLVQLFITNGLI